MAVTMKIACCIHRYWRRKRASHEHDSDNIYANTAGNAKEHHHEEHGAHAYNDHSRDHSHEHEHGVQAYGGPPPDVEG
jgi:ABC-type Zn2+ transport system substrate-binding protein/surface adhesin